MFQGSVNWVSNIWLHERLAMLRAFWQKLVVCALEGPIFHFLCCINCIVAQHDSVNISSLELRKTHHTRCFFILLISVLCYCITWLSAIFLFTGAMLKVHWLNIMFLITNLDGQLLKYTGNPCHQIMLYHCVICLTRSA